jgi:hypothetical protein
MSLSQTVRHRADSRSGFLSCRERSRPFPTSPQELRVGWMEKACESLQSPVRDPTYWAQRAHSRRTSPAPVPARKNNPSAWRSHGDFFRDRKTMDRRREFVFAPPPGSGTGDLIPEIDPRVLPRIFDFQSGPLFCSGLLHQSVIFRVPLQLSATIRPILRRDIGGGNSDRHLDEDFKHCNN